jgi:hypothetical protein
MDGCATLTESELFEDMRGKLFSQINLVLVGKERLVTGGSFTVTSGIFADQGRHGVTSGAIISGALHQLCAVRSFEAARGFRRLGRARACLCLGRAGTSATDERT